VACSGNEAALFGKYLDRSISLEIRKIELGAI